ncbi:hypothetical protein BLA39750_02393 [Burkholderia lata]|uniref:Uncharacterized protein n=1 Tax=Burkholderia lata (strain ATCC 17760 / DSM 23089 / LMG 22485 / NCIMB 9086 / R18194 / 383) TaxID=482957 RepID=A0A6P2WPT7_BURL3|nr:hypothetical protein BLA39750_02393 [Burkholderia lata]
MKRLDVDLHDVVQCFDLCNSWLGDPERIDNLKHQRGQRRTNDLLSGKREFKQRGNITPPFRGVHDGDGTTSLARHIDQGNQDAVGRPGAFPPVAQHKVNGRWMVRPSDRPLDEVDTDN